MQNPKTKIQEQMRKKVIEIYLSGKGYKATSKGLRLHQTTGKAVIHKWRKHGTVVKLLRSGQRTKIISKAQRRLIQEVIKHPQQHPENCRPHLPQLRAKFMPPT